MLGIALSVIIGGLLGFFCKSSLILAHADNLIKFGLCLLLFFVGIDIGKNQSVFEQLKTLNKKVLLRFSFSLKFLSFRSSELQIVKRQTF